MDDTGRTVGMNEPTHGTSPIAPMAAPEDMLWMPGGVFLLVRRALRGGAAFAHRVAVRSLQDGRSTSPTRISRRLCTRRRIHHRGSDRSRSRPVRRDDPELRCRRRRSSGAGRPVDLSNHYDWWTFVLLRVRASSTGSVRARSGACEPRVLHVAVEDVEANRLWAGKEIRPRPNGSSRPAAASRAPSTPGATSSLPTAGTWRTRGRETSRTSTTCSTASSTRPPSAPSPQRLRPLRHGRKRLGMDGRLVPGPRGGRSPVLHDREPTRRRPSRELRSHAVRIADSPQGDEGRVASVRSELLPALPTGGPDAATHRYLHIPPRLSLHFPAHQDSGILVARWERMRRSDDLDDLAAFDHVELVDDAGVDTVVAEDLIDL